MPALLELALRSDQNGTGSGQSIIHPWSHPEWS